MVLTHSEANMLPHFELLFQNGAEHPAELGHTISALLSPALFLLCLFRTKTLRECEEMGKRQIKVVDKQCRLLHNQQIKHKRMLIRGDRSCKVFF